PEERASAGCSETHRRTEGGAGIERKEVIGGSMGTRTVALACVSVLAAASSVSAQFPVSESLTPLQTAVACASPPVRATEPVDAVRIVGSQDVVQRGIFG